MTRLASEQFQTPLTQEELFHKYIIHEPVWLEHLPLDDCVNGWYFVTSYTNEWVRMENPYRFVEELTSYYLEEWRCWARQPTFDERDHLWFSYGVD